MGIKNLIYYYTKYCGFLSLRVDSEWRTFCSSTDSVISVREVGIGLWNYHAHKDFDGDIHVKVKQDANKQYFIDIYYPNFIIERTKCSSIKTICCEKF